MCLEKYFRRVSLQKSGRKFIQSDDFEPMQKYRNSVFSKVSPTSNLCICKNCEVVNIDKSDLEKDFYDNKHNTIKK